MFTVHWHKSVKKINVFWGFWYVSNSFLKPFIHSFHWHVQNATIPCRSQELLPFLSVMYFFLPPFSTNYSSILSRGELSYLAPLDSENISAPYFKQCFFQGGGITPQTESNTTPPSPKTEITNVLFYILNFALIIKFKM